MMYKKLYPNIFYEAGIIEMFIDIVDELTIEAKIELFSKYGDYMKEFYLSNLEKRNELPEEYKIDSRTRIITFPKNVIGDTITIGVPVVWEEDKINRYLRYHYSGTYLYKDRIKEEITEGG